MAKEPKTRRKHFPSRDEILEFLSSGDNGGTVRELARAFAIKGADRVELKRLIREMIDDGVVARDRGKRLRLATDLPPVTVVEITGIDEYGDLTARPRSWTGDGPPPRIFVSTRKRRGSIALAEGDVALVRLSHAEDQDGRYYSANVIRRLAAAPSTIVGIFQKGDKGGVILPTERGDRRQYQVAAGSTMGAQPGEIVLAEVPGGRVGRGRAAPFAAEVTERIGDTAEPRAISLIAIHHHGIPTGFSDECLAEAKAARMPDLTLREDLRNLPLVTIDPHDARDHDDAVFAEADGKGGWHIVVAIADVSYFVRPGSALDGEARERGNSCYFPDRVVPMLPEELSNSLCSLVEGQDRPVVAAHLWITDEGELRDYRFTRAVMRSHAFINYHQTQAALDGHPDEQTGPILDSALKPLLGAYRALEVAREARQPLEIELPERIIELDEDGNVTGIRLREALTSHRIVEDFMILANRAAASLLIERNIPTIFRVHEEPTREKIIALGDFLKTLGLGLSRGERMRPELFNRLLDAERGSGRYALLNEVILRSQTQAYYSPENLGHFGLNLGRYLHFTSPIRRYADLVVHRGLMRAIGEKEGALEESEVERLDKTAQIISDTERRAMAAERESKDRYLAAYMSQHLGERFKATISGVTRFGLFVSLPQSGADGLIPISTLADDYYRFNEKAMRLEGEHTGQRLTLGDVVDVRLVEAEPYSGSLRFERISEYGLPEGLVAPRAKHQHGGGKRKTNRKKTGRKGRR